MTQVCSRLLVLVLAAGCAHATAVPAGPMPSPSRSSARSADALARLFTDDGFVLQPGRPPTRDHDEIVQAYTGSGGPLALRALAYTTDGDVGYIVGAYSGAVGRPDDGKFILLVRRAPGGPWKIAADMDNGSRRR